VGWEVVFERQQEVKTRIGAGDMVAEEVKETGIAETGSIGWADNMRNTLCMVRVEDGGDYGIERIMIMVTEGGGEGG
jgi:hypothetical protein